MWIWSLSGEDPLEKSMATHSRIPAWRIPWTEEPRGPQSMGLQSWTRLERRSTAALGNFLSHSMRLWSALPQISHWLPSAPGPLVYLTCLRPPPAPSLPVASARSYHCFSPFLTLHHFETSHPLMTPLPHAARRPATRPCSPALLLRSLLLTRRLARSQHMLTAGERACLCISLPCDSRHTWEDGWAAETRTAWPLALLRTSLFNIFFDSGSYLVT